MKLAGPFILNRPYHVLYRGFCRVKGDRCSVLCIINNYIYYAINTQEGRPYPLSCYCSLTSDHCKLNDF